MASVLFGGGISQVRGSIAGQTFSRNANGAYIRNKGININSNSIAQQTVRNSFGSISRLWQTLGTSLQQGWVVAAAAFTYKNRMGEQSHYTGKQLYQLVNSSLDAINVLPLQVPPTPVHVPPTLSVVGNFAIGAGAYNVTAKFIIGNTHVPAGFTAIIMATAPMSNGVLKYKPNMFRQIALVKAPDLMSVNINIAYLTKFGFYPSLGDNLAIRVVLVSDLTGQRNAGLMVKTTVVA